MTEQNETDEWGIDRRTVLKGVGVASVTGFVGVPAFSGSVAAANGTETMTVRSGTFSTVTGYRAGDEEGEFPTSEPDEPADLTWVHPAWDGTSHDFDDETRWIWHCDEDSNTGQTTADVEQYGDTGDDEEDTYFVKAPKEGDVVKFEDSFDIPGTPKSGMAYATADNGYELYVNDPDMSGSPVISGQVSDSSDTDWEDSDLDDSFVDGTAGEWDEVESGSISSYLQSGENIVTVLAGNTKRPDQDEQGNPGGVIYELDIEYETCIPCDLDEALKYEFAYDDSEDGFFPEEGEDTVGYHSYESKDDEHYEPVSVTFANPENYCLDSFEVTVKAGPVTGTVEPTLDDDGNLVVSIGHDEYFFHPKNEKPYAISYIEFDCVD